MPASIAIEQPASFIPPIHWLVLAGGAVAQGELRISFSKWDGAGSALIISPKGKTLLVDGNNWKGRS